MNLQLRLAWRYLMGRKLRTALTTLAIAFGVMVLGLSGTISAVHGSFRQSLMAAAGQVDLTITGETRGVFDAAAVERVRNTPGVAYATGSLVRAALLPATQALAAGSGKPVNTLSVHGVDPATVAQVRPLVPAEGRLLEPEDTSAMLITADLAQVTGLQPGDRLALPSATGTADLTVVGVVASRPAAGSEEVYVPLATAQALFNLPGAINTIEANVTPASDAEVVGQAVLAALGSGYKLGANVAGAELLSALQEVFQKSQMRAFGAIVQALHLLVLVLAVPSLIALVNTLAISVLERRREIGVLRAVGATRRQVRRMILGESLLLAAIGTAFGILAGLWLGYVLVGAMGIKGFGFRYSFPYAGLLLTLAAGLIFGVAGALIPARQAARLNVVAALQYE